MRRGQIIVLDRDGVINRDSPDYIKSPQEFEPLYGSMEAIRHLGSAGFRVVVASNQSGIGRGLFDHRALRAIHEKLIASVTQAGGKLTAIYVCPHHPDDQCACRKPRPGMLQRLASDLEVDPGELTVIGDSARDLAAAQAVSARPILVRTGNGRRAEAELDSNAGVGVFDDLRAAAKHLVRESGGPG